MTRTPSSPSWSRDPMPRISPWPVCKSGYAHRSWTAPGAAGPPRVGGDLRPAVSDAGRRLTALASRVSDRLAQRGVTMDKHAFPYSDEQYICLLEPRNLGKTSLLEHVLGRFSSVRAVITAGDNSNDTMLFPDAYGSEPNYPVVAGDRKPVAERMAGKPRVEKCGFGGIGPAVDAQLTAIGPPAVIAEVA